MTVFSAQPPFESLEIFLLRKPFSSRVYRSFLAVVKPEIVNPVAEVCHSFMVTKYMI
jgi:hypothetical protein